jgi:uncharacterized protein with NAD-binding domain and iron-sulfur cluster
VTSGNGSGAEGGTRAKRVVVVGGGVGGLSAAHELSSRGFEVHVYERRNVLGGKARSVPFTPKEGVTLPAEHGFRFFPGFYKHVIQTMEGIPLASTAGATVFGNLEPVAQLRALGDVSTDPVLGILPLKTLWEAFTDWVAFLPSFLDVAPLADHKHLTADDMAYFARRIWTFLGMCKERREAELEGMPWSTFIGQGRSDVYQKYLAVGLTRNLVACQADKASALTVGTIGLQLLLDAGAGAVKSTTFDRVLNGPTNEAWIDPWVQHLRGLGVAFHTERELSAIELSPESPKATPRVARLRFASAIPEADGRPRRAEDVDALARELAHHPHGEAFARLHAAQGRDVETVEADYYVFAMPVEQLATFVTEEIAARVPAWAGLPDLAQNVEWMNGVLFYLTRQNDLPTAHADYLDSDWALTSIDQGPRLWPRWSSLRGDDPEVQQIVSVDVSAWNAARTSGPHQGKSAMDLPREAIIEETWTQVKAATTRRYGYDAIDDRLRKYAFVDDDIQERRNLRKLYALHRWRKNKGLADQPLLTNAEPLLVNQVNTRKLRPDAGGAVANAFLASDYVKTYTDLATMEGANEAARRAVNGILAAEGRDDACQLFPLQEPLQFLRDWDEERYRKNLPPSPVVAAMGYGFAFGAWFAVRASQALSAVVGFFRWVEGAPPRPGQFVPAERRRSLSRSG